MDPLELVWWLLEIGFEVAGDLACEVFRAVCGSLEPATKHALFSTFLCFVAGAALGLLSGLLWSERLLPRPRTAGFSLIASPLVSGFAMHAWGSFRRERDHATSVLATFHGGAAFALGAAIGRFALVA
jgi:hypothetical protein